MIKTGVIDPITDELMTIVVCKAIYVKELNIVTPKIEIKTIKKKLFL